MRREYIDKDHQCETKQEANARRVRTTEGPDLTVHAMIEDTS